MQSFTRQRLTDERASNENVAGRDSLAALQMRTGIYCGVSRGGERLGFLVFYDAEQTSETYGEQVALCPGCATALDYRLLTRNSTRDQLL